MLLSRVDHDYRMMMYRADAENNRKEHETQEPAESNLIASWCTFAFCFNEARGCCNDSPIVGGGKE